MFLASFASSNAFLWSVGDTGSCRGDQYTGHVAPIEDQDQGMQYAPVHWVVENSVNWVLGTLCSNNG